MDGGAPGGGGEPRTDILKDGFTDYQLALWSKCKHVYVFLPAMSGV